MERLVDITDEQWASVNPENRKMVEEFLLESVQLSNQTLKQYTSALRIYFWYIHENCGDKSFHAIKSLDFLKYQNFLTRKGLSSSAVKLKRSVVSSFNGYVELYYLEDFPSFRNYISKKIPNPAPVLINAKEPLTLDEYRKLCEELEKREMWQQLAYLKFSFSTGCRRAEVIQLLKEIVNYEPKVSDVEITNDKGEKVIVKSRSYFTHDIRCKGRGKAGKVRKLQFDQDAMDAIIKWLSVRGNDECPYVFVTKHPGCINQVAPETLNGWCSGMFGDIVGRRVHPHLFRETRATSLVMEQGKDIKVVQKLLGHQSSATSEIYVIRKDSDASDEAFT
jgi:site-specific recombinase XerD